MQAKDITPKGYILYDSIYKMFNKRQTEYVTEIRIVVVCGVSGLGKCLGWCIHTYEYLYAQTHIYIVYIVLYKLYSLFVVLVTKVYTFVKMQRTVP